MRYFAMFASNKFLSQKVPFGICQGVNSYHGKIRKYLDPNEFPLEMANS